MEDTTQTYFRYNPTSFSTHTYTPTTQHGPNMDYLRKNIVMACSNTEQMLGFYTNSNILLKKEKSK